MNLFANIYILGYCDKKEKMSCKIYEFRKGKIIPADPTINLTTKDIKIQILCHVKPKGQSFTTCSLFWTTIGNETKEESSLQTLEGEAILLVNVDEGNDLQVWSYFVVEGCLIISSKYYDSSKKKYTIGLLKVNKNSKIKVKNTFSSQIRYGNYTEKTYTITFDNENFILDLKQKERPISDFGQS